MGELIKADLAKLSIKQMSLLQVVEDQGIGETIKSLCEMAEVSTQSFYTWKHTDPNFVRAWNELRERMLFGYRPGVDRALIRKALTGDVPAIRTFYEVEQLGKIALPGKLLINGDVQEADFTIIEPPPAK